jgi:aminoglycoside phosphotransferase (APT) family kinase protein
MSTQTLDTRPWRRYLRGRLPGFEGRLSAEKFPGGQSNPTFQDQRRAAQLGPAPQATG